MASSDLICSRSPSREWREDLNPTLVSLSRLFPGTHFPIDAGEAHLLGLL